MSCEDWIIFFAELGVLCGALGLAGLVADVILPHIPWLTRWIDSLPMMEEGDENDA